MDRDLTLYVWMKSPGQRPPPLEGAPLRQPFPNVRFPCGVGVVPPVEVVQPATRGAHCPRELRDVPPYTPVGVKVPHRPPRLWLEGVALEMPEELLKGEPKPPPQPHEPHPRLGKLPPRTQQFPTEPVRKSNPRGGKTLTKRTSRGKRRNS